MHLVMFGEYIPFAEYLPDDFFLLLFCPEAHHADMPVAFPIMQAGSATTWSDRIGQGSGRQQIQASVNISFESTVAHLIRSQVLTLRKQGHDLRVLINISNDGWFRFSQQIEQHLATHVFRAVENRMWYVTATNGGFSAIISPTGTIMEIGKRGTAEPVVGTLSVNLNEPQPVTIYQKYGDWYALPFAIGVLVFSGIGYWERRKNERKIKQSRNREIA
jgi:apolipoprotein N-acyltransferase